ncbi:helix-turn-helix domain-containing protein [Nitrosopumilus sp.]|uniref:helix-turn-helix domain-containing protein n=1 Tax=Nitrosopumilus sp. TaxID=2024843 RepID=UPI002931DDB3|nr:helix-turn-helix domain-containing protein [Nitrosopumilus sp.]
MKKVTPGQLDKYDIDQKIIRALVDFEARTILFSVKNKAKRAEDIVRETKIPTSSVYKKLERLEELALVTVEKRDFSDSGHITRFYKSRISGAQISIKKTKPILTLFKN